MEFIEPRDIAMEIIKRNAKEIDVQSVSMLVDDIAQALQAERDVWSMRVQVARPEPGDVVVFCAQRNFSLLQIENILNRFKANFPGLRAVVLDGGLTIDRIIRQANEGGNEPG